MKNKKGITLVSLVVTIIVLIILAGVSINLTLGENGIITMAKKARENMELAKVDEERQLNELYMQMEQEGLSGGISYDAIAKLVEFKRQIASAITDMGIQTAANADATTMSSNIRSLTGASSADKVSYDNTNSGLTATNVQGAVDELNDTIGMDSTQIYLGLNASSVNIPFRPLNPHLSSVVVVVGGNMINLLVTAGGDIIHITEGFSASYNDNVLTVSKNTGNFVGAYLTYALVFAPKTTLTF